MSILETKIGSVSIGEGLIPKADYATKRYTDPQGQTWVSRNFLLNLFSGHSETQRKLLANVPSITGKDSRGRSGILYNESKAEETFLDHGLKRKSKPKFYTHTDSEGSRWVSANSIFDELSLSYGSATIRILENIPSIEIKGPGKKQVRVYKEREAISAFRAYTETPVAPEGWITIGRLAGETGRNFSVIKGRASQYRDTHPEWFARRRSSQGRLENVLSPELVRVIRESLPVDLPEVKPPKGWETAHVLADKLRSGHPAIKRIANQYRETHPDWFGRFSVRGRGRKRDYFQYYAPELIEIIAKEVSQRMGLEARPEGWITELGLIKKLRGEGIIGRGRKGIIARRVDTYREAHPEWFGTFLDPKQRTVLEYLSPELVSVLESEMSNPPYSLPPKDWRTRSALLKLAGLDYSETNQGVVNELVEQHPEWEKRQYLRTGGLTDHYSPEASTEILDILKEIAINKSKSETVSQDEARKDLRKLVEVKV